MNYERSGKYECNICPPVEENVPKMALITLLVLIYCIMRINSVMTNAKRAE